MKSEDTINDIKSYYYVITSNLDNMELSHYLTKIPTTYFATFPYIEHYKQMKQRLSQLQQEKEELIKFLKERYCLLTTKTPNAKEEITSYHNEINGRLKELDYVIQYISESKLKESDK